MQPPEIKYKNLEWPTFERADAAFRTRALKFLRDYTHKGVIRTKMLPREVRDVTGIELRAAMAITGAGSTHFMRHVYTVYLHAMNGMVNARKMFTGKNWELHPVTRECLCAFKNGWRFSEAVEKGMKAAGKRRELSRWLEPNDLVRSRMATARRQCVLEAWRYAKKHGLPWSKCTKPTVAVESKVKEFPEMFKKVFAAARGKLLGFSSYGQLFDYSSRVEALEAGRYSARCRYQKYDRIIFAKRVVFHCRRTTYTMTDDGVEKSARKVEDVERRTQPARAKGPMAARGEIKSQASPA